MSSLSKRLLELHYDLLSQEEKEQLEVRIEQEPEVAKLYEEVKQTAKLFAQAAKVEAIPPLNFSTPDEEKSTVAPPPERPESISSTRIPRPTVPREGANIPLETRRIISSAISSSSHLHPPEVRPNETAESDPTPAHAPHRSLWKPFEGRFSTQYRLSNRLLTTCSLLLLIFTFLGFLQIKAQRSLLTQKMFHIKVAGPGVLTRETQNLLAVDVSDFAGNTRSLPVRVRLLDDFENTFVVYAEKTDPQGKLNLAIENPVTLPESVFLEVSAGEPTKTPLPAQTLRQRLHVVDPPPVQDIARNLEEDLEETIPLESVATASTPQLSERAASRRSGGRSSTPDKRGYQEQNELEKPDSSQQLHFIPQKQARRAAPASVPAPAAMPYRPGPGMVPQQESPASRGFGTYDKTTTEEARNKDDRKVIGLSEEAFSANLDVPETQQENVGQGGMGGMSGGMGTTGMGMGGMGGGVQKPLEETQSLPADSMVLAEEDAFEETQPKRARQRQATNAEVLVSHANLNPTDPLRFKVRSDRSEYPLIASISQQGVPLAQVPLKTPASPQEPVSVEIPQNASQSAFQSGLMQISVFDPNTVPPQEIANSVVFRRGKQYLKIEKQPVAGETPAVPGGPGWPETVKITDEQGMPAAAKVRFELWSGGVGLREPAAPSPMLIDNSMAIQSTLEYLSNQPRSFSSKLFTGLTVLGTIAGVCVSLVVGILFLLKRISGYVPLVAAALTGITCVLLAVAMVRDRQFSAFSSQIVKRYAHENEKMLKISPLQSSESEDSSEVEHSSQLLWERLETTDPRGSCPVDYPNQDEFSAQESSPLFLKVEAVDEKNRVGYELWKLR